MMMGRVSPQFRLDFLNLDKAEQVLAEICDMKDSIVKRCQLGNASNVVFTLVQHVSSLISKNPSCSEKDT